MAERCYDYAGYLNTKDTMKREQNELQDKRTTSYNHSEKGSTRKPYVVILEQPISHTRFRFPSEKSVEKIIGENSSLEKKTYPKIQVLNFDERLWDAASVLVSCVSHNTAVPFNHPHNLASPAKVRLKKNVF